MPTVLLLALVAAIGGAIASYVYDDDASIVTRLGYGIATGFVAIAFAGFIAANVAELTVGLAVAALVAAAPLLGLVRPAIRRHIRDDLAGLARSVAAAARRPGLATVGPVVYAVALVAFLWVVFDRVIIEHEGTLATGYVNNLGDLPFHLQIVASFAWGENFPPEHPAYAGTGFSYPYLSDFLTAMFVGLGAGVRESFLVQNMLLGIALVITLIRFTVVITGDRLAGYLAPVLVLFSGGLGWILLFDHARAGEQGLFALLGNLPQDYTITGEGPFRWGNFVTTLFVTQRSLAFGLPIALIVFTLLWQAVHAGRATTPGPEPQPFQRIRSYVTQERRLLAAGVLTGVLPLVHAHTFGVVIGTAFFVGLFFQQWRDGRWRGWAGYVICALALALPAVWWSTHASTADAGSFLGIELGWDRRDENPAWFWFLNTGLFIPLALLAALWPARPRIATRSLLLFTAAFVVWFFVPNVIKLAPWVWDNIKVLIYWFVGFVPLVALLLARLFRDRTALRVTGAAALAALTMAGAIDVWRVASGQTVYQEFDADGTALAQDILSATAPRDLVLHAPTYNSPVFLTGRRSLLGYTGYIWAHGLPYETREADIKAIYAGEPSAAHLLEQYEVDYVVVSPLERSYMTVDDSYFEGFRVVARSGEYTLYEVARS